METIKGIFIIFFLLLLSQYKVYSQDSTARLIIETIEGYTFPTTIYPTLQTSPAIQPFETVIQDVTDIRVYPSANPQSEVHASINKVNPENILFSSNTNFGLSNNSIQGWYMSSNSGQSWFGSDILPNNGLGRGDPSTAFDAIGTAYIVSMGPNANELPDGYMLQRSTNQGSTWSSSVRGTGPTPGFDKEMIAVDNSTNSPYVNYLYCAWTEFIGGNLYLSYAAIKFNRTTNGGQSFSTPITLRQSNNGSGGGQGTCIATGPNGEVYVCWADYSTGSVPADGIGFAKSTDGGSTFTSRIAFNYQGIRRYGQDPRFNNTRVNDFPSIAVDKSSGPYRGRIYIVYPNGGNGVNNKSVIELRFSTDNGSTWSTAQTISNNNGRQNWFPWIAVDDVTGDISVIYYSLDSPSGFSTNTYVAHSSDGGMTWENILVSDVSHITAPIPGFAHGYAGDYIGICAHGGKAYPVWMDDRNGTWQLYTSPLTYQMQVLVTLDQRNSYNQQVGILKKWETANWGNPFNPDSQFNFPVSSQQTILGDQSIISNQKYHRWVRNSVNESNNLNHHSFTIQSFDNNFTSRLEPTQSGIIIKNSLEMSLINGGTIQFKDPWLIDYPDPLYGNTLRNRGMDAPFKQRPSPFYPDYTTSYNGDVYKGVFLNQVPDPNNPNKPYYSVKTDYVQDIYLQQTGRTHKFYFQNWSATPQGIATFQNANTTETPVVFNQENATVQANLYF